MEANLFDEIPEEIRGNLVKMIESIDNVEDMFDKEMKSGASLDEVNTTSSSYFNLYLDIKETLRVDLGGFFLPACSLD